jgi:hypothetical protein
MKTGTVNADKVIGIANRIRITPQCSRGQLIAELIAAIDEDPSNTSNVTGSLEMNLRAMLNWPEVKTNGKALATLSRTLRKLREAT